LQEKAESSGLHRQSMTLTYSVKGTKEKRAVKVSFDPPLLGYEEVKPRLLGMKAEAQEGLGMVRPQSPHPLLSLSAQILFADQSSTNNLFPSSDSISRNCCSLDSSLICRLL
jgi:hypothetical protein